MGNILQCGSQDDQLKQAENALENVKEEAHQYKQRIAELEAQMYKVRVAQLEKALKKERDTKTPNGKSRDENDAYTAGDTESKIGGILSEIDAINQKVNVVASSSSMNRSSTEQPKSDNYGAYAKAEGGAVFRSIMLEAKPPSFGKIYGSDSPEGDKPVAGYNPLYNNPLLKEQTTIEPSGINIKIPPMPSSVLKKQSSNGNILVGSPMRIPVQITTPLTSSKGIASVTKTSSQPTEDEEWMRLAISKARIDEEDREARERPLTLQQQDSLAGLALPAVTTFKRTNNGHEVVESAGV